MQYQKSGIYVCNVSNGIPDFNGSISQTGFTYFSYRGKLKSRYITTGFACDTCTYECDLIDDATLNVLFQINPCVRI